MNKSTADSARMSLPNISYTLISDGFSCCIEKHFNEQLFLDGDGDVLDIFHNMIRPCSQYFPEQVTREHLRAYLTKLFQYYILGNDQPVDCKKYYCSNSTNSWMIFYMFILIFTLIVSMLGNIFVCSIILTVRSLRRKVTYKLLASLSISDFLVSVFVLPIKISNASNNLHFCNNILVCRLFATSDITFFTASVTHLLVVSVDRYLNITRPYFHNQFMLKRWKTIICLVWIYACVWGFFSNLNLLTLQFSDSMNVDKNLCQITNHHFIRALFIVVFFIPCFAMIYINVIIWRIATSQAKRIMRTIFMTQTGGNTSRIKKSDSKASKKILTIFGTFLICWTPVIVMTFVHSFKSFEVNPVVYTLLFDYLPNLNSCLNPFIYCFFQEEFKNGMKTILQRMSSVELHRSSLQRRIKHDEKSTSSSHQIVYTTTEDGGKIVSMVCAKRELAEGTAC